MIKIVLRSFLLTVLLAYSLGTYGQQEEKIKSIFLMKFIENVIWPNKTDSYVIGVIGNSTISKELEARLAVKNKYKITVKDISVNEISSCDVIYLAANKDNSFSRIIEATDSKKILLVTESDFTAKGAGISFAVENNKMHFIVNKSSIEARGLKISTTLLSLGKQV